VEEGFSSASEQTSSEQAPLKDEFAEEIELEDFPIFEKKKQIDQLFTVGLEIAMTRKHQNFYPFISKANDWYDKYYAIFYAIFYAISYAIFLLHWPTIHHVSQSNLTFESPNEKNTLCFMGFYFFIEFEKYNERQAIEN
jgi:hypothetical protein